MKRRVPVPELAPGERRLEGASAHYLVRVLRLRAGDAFVAFDPAAGSEADAETLWAADEALTVRFGALRAGPSAARLMEMTWVQGLAKGDKCDAVVRDATELGATRVIVAHTQRSVVKLDPAKAEARQSRWARIAQEAARQCGRADVPVVDAPCTWAHALDRATAASDEGARFCLWEGATDSLAGPLGRALAAGSRLVFACGPEGGLTAPEVDLAKSMGWSAVSLGPFVLRTETVAAAVLGAARIWSNAK
ncbi:MAG: RsmE family RNA methyltransferase [Polyangiaceae bacterium]